MELLKKIVDNQNEYTRMKHQFRQFYTAIIHFHDQSYDIQYNIALLVDQTYGVFDNLPVNATRIHHKYLRQEIKSIHIHSIYKRH